MIYRYRLKDSPENKDFEARSIKGKIFRKSSWTDSTKDLSDMLGNFSKLVERQDQLEVQSTEIALPQIEEHDDIEVHVTENTDYSGNKKSELIDIIIENFEEYSEYELKNKTKNELIDILNGEAI